MTRLLNVNDANDEDGHGFGGSDKDKDALLNVNDANYEDCHGFGGSDKDKDI